jgi:hypothetical protein
MIINRLLEIIALFFNNLKSLQLGVCADGDSRQLNRFVEIII